MTTTALKDLTRAEAKGIADLMFKDVTKADSREHTYGRVEIDTDGDHNVGVDSFAGFHVRGHGKTWRAAVTRAVINEAYALYGAQTVQEWQDSFAELVIEIGAKATAPQPARDPQARER